MHESWKHSCEDCGHYIGTANYTCTKCGGRKPKTRETCNRCGGKGKVREGYDTDYAFPKAVLTFWIPGAFSGPLVTCSKCDGSGYVIC
jgi:RecJ-like exonuclease